MNLTEGWGSARWAVLLAVTFLTLANVSHTIALRYILLAVLLCWAVVDRWRLVTTLRQLSASARWLAAFLLYALLHSVIFSEWPAVSLAEWRSQLLMGGLWFVAGLVLFHRQRDLSVMDCVVLAGALLVGTEVVLAVKYRLLNGTWLYQEVFTTATKLEFTFFVNFAMAFVATLVGFGKGKTRYPFWLLLLTGGLMFFASFHAGARNGVIGLTYLILSFTFIFVLSHYRNIGFGRLVFFLSMILLGTGAFVQAAFERDTRNQVFVETAKIAWQDTEGQGWLRTGPYPLLANGNTVDPSAYERIAWIRGGLDLIADKPLGYGYDRRAFNQALTLSGYPNQVGHSHSGFIDLGVGLGVPGILLWLGFCFSLVWQGYLAFRKRRDIAGLALMLVTCGFMGRMVLESVSKDHMLHIFLFTVAALLAQMQLNQNHEQHH